MYFLNKSYVGSAVSFTVLAHIAQPDSEKGIYFYIFIVMTEPSKAIKKYVCLRNLRALVW